MFLEKIGKELKEKERLNQLKKKQKPDDYLADSSGTESDDSAANRKKQDTKKIYPVCINFHKKSKLLCICLIDCDIKIYSLKCQGT